MSKDSESVVDRLWNRLETRYGDASGGCDCLDGGAGDALADSDLTVEDLQAFSEGRRSMADLIAELEADVDPGTVDTLGELAAALEERGATAGENPASDGVRVHWSDP